jgi:hypothetical protein
MLGVSGLGNQLAELVLAEVFIGAYCGTSSYLVAMSSRRVKAQIALKTLAGVEQRSENPTFKIAHEQFQPTENFARKVTHNLKTYVQAMNQATAAFKAVANDLQEFYGNHEVAGAQPC